MEQTIQKGKVITESETIENTKRRKEAEAEAAIQEGNYAYAAILFKELADIYFTLEEFDIALRYLDKEEDMKYHTNHQGNISGIYVKYLIPLQVKVEASINNGNINQAKNLLNQLIAIAEQFRLIELIKAYKKKLLKVAANIRHDSG